MGSISVANLGKAYKHYPSRLSRLSEWLSPSRKPRHEKRWVLKDISFNVSPGEAVGIIGINGAGKSTLLKLITGTSHATEGTIELSGRVAALLELGMGLHPDFTGRQNISLAGQLIGLSAIEIEKALPEIEDFAELGEYLDQPVRIYSSGMQVRLAFSIATAVRPSILIIDEALSVGDAHFQHKSFARIRKFKELGTTLLLVSHDKQAIQSICDRALLLNQGTIAMEGSPEKVFDYYNALLVGAHDQILNQEIGMSGRTKTTSGSRKATIQFIKLTDLSNRPLQTIAVGQTAVIHTLITSHAKLSTLVVGCAIKDRVGQLVFGTNTESLGSNITDLCKDESVEVSFTFKAALGPGSYAITIAAQASNPVVDGKYHWIDNAVFFDVVNTKKPHFAGTCWIDVQHTTARSTDKPVDTESC